MALVFEKIIKFYSQEFDEVVYGIDLDNYEKGGIFYPKEVSLDFKGSSLSKSKADL